jgi:hypothetical protein
MAKPMNVAASVRSIAEPLAGTPRDFDAVVDAADRARFVLIGEASHGTHEFYRIRAEITKRLATIAMPSTRSTISGASRNGCGEMRMCSTSSAGCVSGTIRTTPTGRSDSTGSTSTAFTRRWTR